MKMDAYSINNPSFSNSIITLEKKKWKDVAVIKVKVGFNVKYHNELEIEKEKLSRLVDQALKNGTPIIQDEAVMAQNRKIDTLVVRIQKEKIRYTKNQQER